MENRPFPFLWKAGEGQKLGFPFGGSGGIVCFPKSLPKNAPSGKIHKENGGGLFSAFCLGQREGSPGRSQRPTFHASGGALERSTGPNILKMKKRMVSRRAGLSPGRNAEREPPQSMKGGSALGFPLRGARGPKHPVLKLEKFTCQPPPFSRGPDQRRGGGPSQPTTKPLNF